MTVSCLGSHDHDVTNTTAHHCRIAGTQHQLGPRYVGSKSRSGTPPVIVHTWSATEPLGQ
jgi:hypothetical protein